MKGGFFSELRSAQGGYFAALDYLVIGVSLAVAKFIRFGDLNFSEPEIIVGLTFMLLTKMCLSLSGLYDVWVATDSTKWIRSVIASVAISAVLLLAIAFGIQKSDSFSRIWFFLTLVFTPCFLIWARFLYHNYFFSLTRGIHGRYRLLIVGAGELGISTARKIKADESLGIQVVGYFDDSPELEGSVFADVPVLGTNDELLDYIESQRINGDPIDYVWLALPDARNHELSRLVRQLSDTTVRTSYIPDFSMLPLFRHEFDSILDIPLLDVSENLIYGTNANIKNIVDKIFALLMILILMPVFLVIALLVFAELKGSVIFSQRRYGLNGQEIRVFKFQTMTVKEDGGDIKAATVDDLRITRIGKYLRKTSLDELPQLFNVLSGSMSLVGPRPHAVSHNEQFRKLIGGYMSRHSAKPGITGLAQVSGCRGEIKTIEDLKRRVAYDRLYLSRWSMLLDLKIMAQTVKIVALAKGAH